MSLSRNMCSTICFWANRCTLRKFWWFKLVQSVTCQHAREAISPSLSPTFCEEVFQLLGRTTVTTPPDHRDILLHGQITTLQPHPSACSQQACRAPQRSSQFRSIVVRVLRVLLLLGEIFVGSRGKLEDQVAYLLGNLVIERRLVLWVAFSKVLRERGLHGQFSHGFVFNLLDQSGLLWGVHDCEFEL